MEMQVAEHVVRVSLVTLKGRLDINNAPVLRSRLQELLNQGFSNFVLDLSEVTFMDSAIMAAFISLLKNARLKEGDVAVVAPRSDDARRIFHLTKFDRVFIMKTTVNDALKAF